MNNPHEQQAAALGVDWTAMVRTAEPSDGEQLRECINSGQVSAAQVVAHARADELAVQPETYSEFRSRFINIAGSLPNQRESWEAGYISGGFDEKQKTARIERNRDMWQTQCARQAEQLTTEREEVARLREALKQCKYQAENMRVWGGMGWTYHPPAAGRIHEAAESALTAPGEKHE